jgi:hypothetical protein
MPLQYASLWVGQGFVYLFLTVLPISRSTIFFRQLPRSRLRVLEFGPRLLMRGFLGGEFGLEFVRFFCASPKRI